MKKLFTFKNLIQLVLAGFAFITFNACYEIGNKSYNSKGQLKNVERSIFETNSSKNITSSGLKPFLVTPLGIYKHLALFFR